MRLSVERCIFQRVLDNEVHQSMAMAVTCRGMGRRRRQLTRVNKRTNGCLTRVSCGATGLIAPRGMPSRASWRWAFLRDTLSHLMFTLRKLIMLRAAAEGVVLRMQNMYLALSRTLTERQQYGCCAIAWNPSHESRCKVVYVDASKPTHWPPKWPPTSLRTMDAFG